MKQPVINKNRALECKTTITVLAAFALVCGILGSIENFFIYTQANIHNVHMMELTVRFPWLLGLLNLISLALTLAPSILLMLYTLKFFRVFKATIIVPIIFGCIAARPILNFINAFVFSYGLNGINLITNLITIITFTLATISALKGLSNKIFIIIPTALSIALSLLSLMRLSYNSDFYARITLSLFTNLASIIASITLNTSLLLFGLKNRIPAILAVSPEKEKKKVEKMSPEQALRLLNDKLELGMITKEEYQSQRAEIINNL